MGEKHKIVEKFVVFIISEYVIFYSRFYDKKTDIFIAKNIHVMESVLIEMDYSHQTIEFFKFNSLALVYKVIIS